MGFLEEVYSGEGPYATVYLENRPAGEDAAEQWELRWQGLRQQLLAEGTDQPTLAALDEALTPSRPGNAVRHGRVLVAASGQIRLDRPLPDDPVTPVTDQATWAPLPHLIPLLAAEGRRVPHILVIADRIGADVHLAAEGTERVSIIDGMDNQLRKVQAGGWSHRRFQQRAENHWEQNATLVADEVARLAVRHRVKLVVLAGDVRARTAIASHLPANVASLVVETDHGSRAAGAAQDPLRAEIRRLLTETARREHSELIARFQEAIASTGRAVEGLEATVETLRLGQVATLLLPSQGTRHHLWVGPKPTEIAVTRGELERMGVEEYAYDRADAALLRACVGTGAGIELLSEDDPPMTDGVGVLLRYQL